jgi:anti-anti-sigma factor
LSTPSEFDVSTQTTSPGVLTVSVVGELDMSTSARVEEAISSAASAERVIVDLTKCTFLDSAGVRLLLQTHRKLTPAGARVELVASDPNIRRVLEITSVNTVLPVHSTLDAAL